MDVTARADEEHHNRRDDQQNPGDDEGFQKGATRRWSKPDSNPRSRHGPP
jgi:hypothetical protein